MIKYGAVPILLAVTLLAGCASAPKPVAKPIDVHGTVSAPIDSNEILGGRIVNRVGSLCTAGAQFTDISVGSQVVVTDASGKTVATGSLQAGALTAGPNKTAFDAICTFPFDVSKVPANSKYYGVHVGGAERQTEQISSRDMRSPVVLTFSK